MMGNDNRQVQLDGKLCQLGERFVVSLIYSAVAGGLPNFCKHIDAHRDRLAATILHVLMPRSDVVQSAFVEAAPPCFQQKAFWPVAGERRQEPGHALLQAPLAVLQRKVEYIALGRFDVSQDEAIERASDTKIIEQPALTKFRSR